MSDRCDALVLFGATGDLAGKKLYPALHQLARTGVLPDTVVGVAASDWSDAELVEYARASIEENGEGIDPVAFERLAGALSYVAGDYRQADTYERLAAALGPPFEGAADRRRCGAVASKVGWATLRGPLCPLRLTQAV